MCQRWNSYQRSLHWDDRPRPPKDVVPRFLNFNGDWLSASTPLRARLLGNYPFLRRRLQRQERVQTFRQYPNFQIKYAHCLFQILVEGMKSMKITRVSSKRLWAFFQRLSNSQSEIASRIRILMNIAFSSRT